MSKIKVSYSCKGDMTILQQQVDQAIKKALSELDNEQQKQPSQNYKQIRAILERRLQQFFMNSFSRFRSTVEYSKSHEKEAQKVIMQPDLNLQKINEVKLSMLRQSLMKAQRQKWPQLKNKIQIVGPQKLEIVHFEGFKQNINQSVNRNFQKIVDYSKQVQKIRIIEDSIVQSVAKIEVQERYDRDFFGLK